VFRAQRKQQRDTSTMTCRLPEFRHERPPLPPPHPHPRISAFQGRGPSVGYTFLYASPRRAARRPRSYRQANLACSKPPGRTRRTGGSGPRPAAILTADGILGPGAQFGRNCGSKALIVRRDGSVSERRTSLVADDRIATRPALQTPARRPFLVIRWKLKLVLLCRSR